MNYWKGCPAPVRKAETASQTFHSLIFGGSGESTIEIELGRALESTKVGAITQSYPMAIERCGIKYILMI